MLLRAPWHERAERGSFSVRTISPVSHVPLPSAVPRRGVVSGRSSHRSFSRTIYDTCTV